MSGAVMLYLCAVLLGEPQSVSSTIRGTVTAEATGQRIAHAKIAVDRSLCVTVSDSNGVYRFQRVPTGIHTLVISAPGFADLTFEKLMVPPTGQLVIHARLRDRSGGPSKGIIAEFAAPGEWSSMSDKMLFYQPDSTIDYRIRIVNPQAPVRRSGLMRITIPDSSAGRRR